MPGKSSKRRVAWKAGPNASADASAGASTKKPGLKKQILQKAIENRQNITMPDCALKPKRVMDMLKALQEAEPRSWHRNRPVSASSVKMNVILCDISRDTNHSESFWIYLSLILSLVSLRFEQSRLREGVWGKNLPTTKIVFPKYRSDAKLMDKLLAFLLVSPNHVATCFISTPRPPCRCQDYEMHAICLWAPAQEAERRGRVRSIRTGKAYSPKFHRPSRSLAP